MEIEDGPELKKDDSKKRRNGCVENNKSNQVYDDAEQAANNAAGFGDYIGPKPENNDNKDNKNVNAGSKKIKQKIKETPEFLALVENLKGTLGKKILDTLNLNQLM